MELSLFKVILDAGGLGLAGFSVWLLFRFAMRALDTIEENTAALTALVTRLENPAGDD